MTRSFTFVLLLIVLFIVLAGPMAAQDSSLPVLTPLEANPVFSADPSIGWEAGGALPLEILPYNGGWIMFYLGGNAEQTTWSVGYATSEDGLAWTRHDGNPVFVLDPELGPSGVRDFSVFTTQEQWVMLFVPGGNDSAQSIRVATAPSPEGPWSIADEAALAAPGILDWDGAGIAAQMVRQAGDEYVMYFAGNNWSHPCTTGKIGRAASPDGFSWTLYDNPETTRSQFVSSDPVFTANANASAWDRAFVYGSLVLPATDGWEMFYSGGNETGREAIGYATSRDGIHWLRQGDAPVLSDPAMFFFTPIGVVTAENGPYLYYFSSPDRDPAHLTMNAAAVRYP